VDDQRGDEAQVAPLRLRHESAEVAHAAEGGIDVAVIGNVVAVIAPRAWVERQQPQRGDAKVAQVVELLGEPGEITDAVAVAVAERLYVQLVDDRVLEPQAIVRGLGRNGDLGPDVHGGASCSGGNGGGGAVPRSLFPSPIGRGRPPKAGG